jgi:hypothetical protein
MASKTARRAGLALAGLAVAGSSMVGLAGTAEAATPAQSHSSTVAQWGGGGWGGGNNEVAGIYRSYRQCQWAGIRGERFGRWEDFDCDYAGGGGWSGQWQSSWGQPFNQFWSGGGWSYRGVWVLRVDDCD